MPVDRREFLWKGGKAMLVAWLLPGCDKLSLPPEVAVTDTGGGVAWPPITSNDDFYVTSSQLAPLVNADTWTLSIRDRGKEKASLTFADLQAMAARDKEHTLQCIGGGPGNL